MRRLSPKVVVSVAALAALTAGLAFYLRPRPDRNHFVTARVTRGAITRAVSATGTLNPVTTVQVGTYVSGPIQAIYADFNSPVKAGQLIAKIDPRSFEVKVAAARAAVAHAKAQLLKDRASLEFMEATYRRTVKLAAQHTVSAAVLDNARSAYHQAKAQIALDRAMISQKEADLKDAEVKLEYTNIVSPVDGIVVSRNVDVGQTVAATFQTPTLFLIAKDLTKMQVDASVSESDIGEIRLRQPATFTVDAFPQREFHGSVAQVRQAPITVQNVVTYDVVINVANPELLLRPGMTATVAIVTARRASVVRVPIDALRFSPPHAKPEESSLTEDGRLRRHARVWMRAAHGLKPVAITTGLDDGEYVEVLEGDLRPGEKVVTDEVSDEKKKPSLFHLPR